MQETMTSSWHELRVEAPQDFLDAIGNFLFELGAAGLQEESDSKGGALVAYFREGNVLAPVRAYLHALGLAGRSSIRARVIEQMDWANSWRQSFSPLPIGRRLWIHPPWLPSVPPERESVCIEPGMAFGTGQHASTRGCLELLELAVGEHSVKRALDLGTGSGILAIALAKLGVRSVVAADTDPIARAVAAGNARRNRVEKQVCIVEDWQRSEPYDLIVANLFSDLLCSLASALSACVPRDGAVICSGYLSCDRPRVERCLEGASLTLRRSWEHDNWLTQHFVRTR